jgi:hypothetical protein
MLGLRSQARCRFTPGRRHGINPFDYLKDLFSRLPSTKITQIKESTPAAWAKARERAAQAAQENWLPGQI